MCETVRIVTLLKNTQPRECEGKLLKNVLVPNARNNRQIVFFYNAAKNAANPVCHINVIRLQRVEKLHKSFVREEHFAYRQGKAETTDRQTDRQTERHTDRRPLLLCCFSGKILTEKKKEKEKRKKRGGGETEKEKNTEKTKQKCHKRLEKRKHMHTYITCITYNIQTYNTYIQTNKHTCTHSFMHRACIQTKYITHIW